MRLISSRLTFFPKRVFPILWLGFLAYLVATNLVTWVSRREAAWGLVSPVVIVVCTGVLVYAFMSKTLFGLVDEVWDADSELVVRNRGSEEHVPLSAIMNVGYSLHSHPQRVILTVREDGGLPGREILFIPRLQEPFSRNPIIDDLIQRVDAARRSA